MTEIGEITRLLQASQAGEPEALNEVLRQMYSALHQLAASQLRTNRSERTLSATALVNEAFLRIFSGERIPAWESRGHLMGIAARAMRQVLVDAARRRNAAKRPHDIDRFNLSEITSGLEQDVDPSELDEVLIRLESIDEQQAKIVEMRFFVGLNAEEIGAALGISASTVQREWRMARAWLQRELAAEPST